jgi:GNAT superfamily N-acetyltransferase
MDERPMGADERVEATTADGAAHALLWWRQTPSLEGMKIGAIGGFHGSNAAATRTVLDQACGILRAQNCALAVGPMDGTTWRNYRFVTDRGEEPPFFLEPSHPTEWPGWWREAGFDPLANYFSAVNEDLARRDVRVVAVEKRLTESGIGFRPVAMNAFDDELGRIYDVSVLSFQQNFLYSPLPRPEFIAQYRMLHTKVRPELVWLAEQGRRPVGYVFAIPDLAQVQRGEKLTTLVVKTLAVVPGRATAGLGAVLLDRVHEEARRMGFTRAIHALMHETNSSRNLSAHSARLVRRYTLFARQLTSA